jgi:hypothetical protein
MLDQPSIFERPLNPQTAERKRAPEISSHSLSSKKLLVLSAFPRWTYYFLQAIVIAGILTLQLGLTRRHLSVPIDFKGDTVYEAAIAKAIVSDGWWWHARGLSAPTGLDLVAVPIMGNLDCSIIKVIALFTHRAGLVLNLYWLLTVLLAGFISTWSLQCLGVHRWVAIVLGILYALCPHIYFRHTAHLGLTHHLIPLVATAAILLAMGRTDVSRRGPRYGFLAGCILIGFSYIYWAFFSCFVLLVGGGIGFLRQRSLRVVSLTGLAVGLVVAAAALNLVPSIWAWSDQPELRKFTTYKTPAEAEYYGLKIRQLIAPASDSPIPLFARVADKTRAANFPLENENTLSRMGLIASVGFLLLVGVNVFGIYPARGPTIELLKPVGALTLACVLLGTIGGFGSIFNLFVAPDVRCYNRISIFIVFFSLTAVGIVLTKWASVSAKSTWSLAGTAVCLALLLIIGVVDQNEASVLNVLAAQDKNKFEILSSFLQRIESELPRDAMVYQLPQSAYGDDARLKQVMWNAQEEPFLVSNSIRWSWPAVSGEAQTFGRILEQLNASALVDALSYRGYDGVFIDKLGYADGGERLIAGLSTYLGSAPLQSANGRYAFFGFSGTPAKIAKTEGSYVWGTPVVFTPAGSAARYIGEGWSCPGCVDGRNATMKIRVSRRSDDIMVRAHITPTMFGKLRDIPVQVFVNRTRVGRWDVLQPAWYSSLVPRTALKNTSLVLLDFQLPRGESSGSVAVNKELGLPSLHFDAIVLAPQTMKAELNLGPTLARPAQQVQISVADSGFEDTDLSPWRRWLDVIPAITSSRAHSGNHSLAESSGMGSVYQDVTDLEPGYTYTITAWMSGAAGATAPGQIVVGNGANETPSSAEMTPSQNWQLLTDSVVANKSGTLRIHLFRKPGAGTIFWDDVRVYREQ